MHFFVPDLTQTVYNGDFVRHFFSMRIQSKQICKICDLKGRLAEIEILEVNKKNNFITVKILKNYQKLKPEEKILYQAVLDRNYLDKLVEIAPLSGITKIYFFFGDYSIKYNLNLERLNKILIRSCEQGQIAFLPEIKLITKSELLENIKNQLVVVLDIVDKFETSQKIQILQKYQSIIVGCEGGFSPAEKEIFSSLTKINLGETVYPGWLAGFVHFSQKI